MVRQSSVERLPRAKSCHAATSGWKLACQRSVSRFTSSLIRLSHHHLECSITSTSLPLVTSLLSAGDSSAAQHKSNFWRTDRRNTFCRNQKFPCKCWLQPKRKVLWVVLKTHQRTMMIIESQCMAFLQLASEHAVLPARRSGVTRSCCLPGNRGSERLAQCDSGPSIHLYCLVYPVHYKTVGGITLEENNVLRNSGCPR